MSEQFDQIYEKRMAGSGLTFDFGPNGKGEDVII